ncbi:MAG: hypothetical protein A4E47_01660 [Methanosaeta sp. PtaU1.Bin028]|nr:MAG: hypothetical protein A4E47_01660 [Methanosaeta sp. PtaU1.Bin028]
MEATVAKAAQVALAAKVDGQSFLLDPAVGAALAAEAATVDLVLAAMPLEVKPQVVPSIITAI